MPKQSLPADFMIEEGLNDHLELLEDSATPDLSWPYDGDYDVIAEIADSYMNYLSWRLGQPNVLEPWYYMHSRLVAEWPFLTRTDKDKIEATLKGIYENWEHYDQFSGEYPYLWNYTDLVLEPCDQS